MGARERRSAQAESSIPGSVGVLRIFGVPVRFHFTFLLLLVFLLFVSLGGKQPGIQYVLYVLGLFASVLLHELGHAVVSRQYGIRTLEIVMFPIGGVARLERSPRPREELWIAIAGPAVNLAIAALILGLVERAGLGPALRSLGEPADARIWTRIGAGNLVLALFNLLPAFPMDGGRILRSLVGLYKPEDEATRIAAGAGRALAVLMGLYGLLSMNFLLLFIAFFVYLGAAQEGAAAMGRSLTHGLPVRAAMVTDFRTLSHGDTIGDAARLLLATSQQDFPVVHGEQVLGLLGRAALLRAMASEGPSAYVAGVMNRDFVQVPPDMDLAEALPLLAQAGSCALVMEEGRLLGLLTSENVAEFVVLRRVGMPVA
ncbi:MAG: site-2 protease family protein [Bryobacterales bacterium]|nr:site-2 protease family protein [Bryobacteraceae bacterium]MDW8353942.1 site-2 protease family protein [Bryobacterales bacterium]